MGGNLKRAHQVGSVGSFTAIQGCVVVDGELAVALIGQQLLQLGDESIRVAQVEGTEIREEGFIHEILVDIYIGNLIDAEVVGIRLVPGCRLVRDPIQLL